MESTRSLRELDKKLTKINHDLDKFDEIISQISEEDGLAAIENKLDQIKT